MTPHPVHPDTDEPTDEVDTEVFDEPRHGRKRSPTKRGLASGSVERDDESTDVDPDRDAKTRVTAPRPKRPTTRGAPGPKPIVAERSEPLPIISMKDALSASAEKRAAKEHRVHLRPLSEVRRADTQPQNLGYLAPPRDPKAVRVRRLHDLVVWGSAVVIVGCLVMLAVWFLARN